jgi:hypothetical protein
MPPDFRDIVCTAFAMGVAASLAAFGATYVVLAALAYFFR